jgi:hypothetical protein
VIPSFGFGNHSILDFKFSVNATNGCFCSAVVAAIPHGYATTAVPEGTAVIFMMFRKLLE